MHGREGSRESLQGWGRGEERREKVAMHGRERNRERLQGGERKEERGERVAIQGRERNTESPGREIEKAFREGGEG
jgi:hypothetical protein